MTRKRHEYYSKLNFEFIMSDKGRPAAKCLTCNSVKKNTAISRLQAHRNICSNLPISRPVLNNRQKESDDDEILTVIPKRKESNNFKMEHVEMETLDEITATDELELLDDSERDETPIESKSSCYKSGAQSFRNSNYNFEVLDNKIKSLPVGIQFDLICDIHAFARDRIEHYKQEDRRSLAVK